MRLGEVSSSDGVFGRDSARPLAVKRQRSALSVSLARSKSRDPGFVSSHWLARCLSGPQRRGRGSRRRQRGRQQDAVVAGVRVVYGHGSYSTVQDTTRSSMRSPSRFRSRPFEVRVRRSCSRRPATQRNITHIPRNNHEPGDHSTPTEHCASALQFGSQRRPSCRTPTQHDISRPGSLLEQEILQTQ